jgi:uncharacterized membrane protein YphA (DoxX/SURF4 family)
MKPKIIGYWAVTALVALAMGFGGVMDLSGKPEVTDGMKHLGYPAYLATILGIWKILGTIVILVPKFPVLKEWAYAGMIFDLTGAAFSHAAVQDPISNVVTPLIISLLVMASWYLRPEAYKMSTAKTA